MKTVLHITVLYLYANVRKEKQMKAIKVNDDFILRQTGLRINREENTADIVMKLEPRFGASYNEIAFRNIREFYFSLRGESQAEGWGKIKDASGSQTVKELANIFISAFELIGEFRRRAEEEGTKKLVIQETVRNTNGEKETFFWWEGEEGYEEARARTQQEPELQEVPWDRAEEFEAIEKRLVEADIEDLYNAVEKIGAVDTFGEVIDI